MGITGRKIVALGAEATLKLRALITNNDCLAFRLQQTSESTRTATKPRQSHNCCIAAVAPAGAAPFYF